MDPTVLTALSAAALVLALLAAVGVGVQSRRLLRLRDEAGAREREVARMRADLDAVRGRSRPAETAEVAGSGVPRPRVPTSPTAWRRARSGGSVRTRRTLVR